MNFKILPFIVITIFMSACGASIKTVVDSNIKESYRNPLFVLPFEHNTTENFCYKVKDELSIQMAGIKQSGSVLMFEKKRTKLSLNTENKNNDLIDSTIRAGNHDLLVFFNPTNLMFSNNSLQSVSYEIIGVDIVNNKEIWKARLDANSGFGPSMFAKKSARYVIEKLKSDRVL